MSSINELINCFQIQKKRLNNVEIIPKFIRAPKLIMERDEARKYFLEKKKTQNRKMPGRNGNEERNNKITSTIISRGGGVQLKPAHYFPFQLLNSIDKKR